MTSGDRKLKEITADIISEMSLSNDYRKVLRTAVNRISALFEARICSLMVIDDDGCLKIRAQKGLSPAIASNVRLKKGEGISGKVLESGKPVLVRDIEKSRTYRKKNDARYYTHSFLSAPLTVKKKIIGVINLNNKKNREPFTKKDLTILKPVLNHISVIINNSLLNKELKKKNSELGRKVQMLTTLFDVSQDVIAQADVGMMLRKIFLKSMSLLNGSSGSLMLYDETRDRLTIKVSEGLSPEILRYFKKQAEDKSIAYWVLRHSKPLLLLGDIQQDRRFSELKFQENLKSVLSVPLKVTGSRAQKRSSVSVPLHHNQRTIGVININRKKGRSDFSKNDLEFLTVLSSHLALAVENAKLILERKRSHAELNKVRRSLKKALEDLENELVIAGKIQYSMLPDTFPKIPNIGIKAVYMPSRDIGGDMYDVIQLSKDIVCFYIFDVAGHGIPAALIAAMAKTVFTRRVEKSLSPSEILTEINTEMCRIIDDERFVTAFMCILDLRNMKLDFCQGGHPPVYLLRSDRREPEELRSEGSLLGIYEDTLYEDRSVNLQKGDKVILYTDGYVDNFNSENTFFGRERFRNTAVSLKKKPVEEIVECLIKAHKDFLGDCAQIDDVAMLGFEVR
ncbi:MAG: SpoIIE family protein phosphatase [Fibrobacterota bacterium]